MKKFNTTGICRPEKHYMVDIQERLIQIKEMVDDGQYFVINRARQYGKTTTLFALKKFLAKDYLVVFLDFQSQMSTRKFENEMIFSIAFLEAFLKKISFDEISSSLNLKEKLEQLNRFYRDNPERLDLVELFNLLSEVCAISEKPIVLMIDEVDSASNNQVFLDFLAQLRDGFLARDEEPAFHSVILAGLYDIKNLKQKIRSEQEHKTNSPWNIAADYDIVMSLSEAGIANMLEEYNREHQISMDVSSMAKDIYDYTSGYPFLVSRICKLIDEKIAFQMSKEEAWTHRGFVEALKLLYNEKNTLFDSLTHRMEENKELETLVYDVLFMGKHILYDSYNTAIEQAQILGFVKNKDGAVAITNRIFETRLYNMFLSTSESRSTSAYVVGMKEKNQFISNGNLDMEQILYKFVQHYTEIYGDREEVFIENEGRRLFLLYLRPIINGVGNYYIEAQTRDSRRTDVIVDYNGQQYIIELKIWHEDRYHMSAEEQLSDYLDTYHAKKGYLLTFSFNKKKEAGVKTVTYKDKIIVEAIV